MRQFLVCIAVLGMGPLLSAGCCQSKRSPQPYYPPQQTPMQTHPAQPSYQQPQTIPDSSQPMGTIEPSTVAPGQ